MGKLLASSASHGLALLLFPIQNISLIPVSQKSAQGLQKVGLRRPKKSGTPSPEAYMCEVGKVHILIVFFVNFEAWAGADCV